MKPVPLRYVPLVLAYIRKVRENNRRLDPTQSGYFDWTKAPLSEREINKELIAKYLFYKKRATSEEVALAREMCLERGLINIHKIHKQKFAPVVSKNGEAIIEEMEKKPNQRDIEVLTKAGLKVDDEGTFADLLLALGF